MFLKRIHQWWKTLQYKRGLAADEAIVRGWMTPRNRK